MQLKFADILEAVEELPLNEKEVLVDILQNRLIEIRRNQLEKDIENAEREFEQGLCKPATVDEIMREVLS
ncbi:MAG: hypothetical protein H0V31_04720 [Acidobacteria bacterium]|jgi:hypothetical protein|nr:hypothetical protein [Acidobacteriota bacterium]